MQVLTDFTEEGLMEELCENPRGTLVVCDELSAMLGGAVGGKYSTNGPNVALLLSGYDYVRVLPTPLCRLC